MRRKTASLRSIRANKVYIPMNKAIAIILSVAVFGAFTYFLSQGSGGQTVASGTPPATVQTSAPTQTTGQGNQRRYRQQNTTLPSASTTTKTS
jgi:hypothetical protein